MGWGLSVPFLLTQCSKRFSLLFSSLSNYRVLEKKRDIFLFFVWPNEPQTGRYLDNNQKKFLVWWWSIVDVCGVSNIMSFWIFCVQAHVWQLGFKTKHRTNIQLSLSCAIFDGIMLHIGFHVPRYKCGTLKVLIVNMMSQELKGYHKS